MELLRRFAIHPAAARSPGPPSAGPAPAPAGASPAGGPRRRGRPPCASCRPVTGTAMPQVSGSTTPASWAIALVGRLAQQGAELVRRQPSRRDPRTAPRYSACTCLGWSAISASPAEDTCTGMPSGDLRPVRHRSAAGKPLHEERLPAVQHGQVHVLVEHLLDVLHERHGRLRGAPGWGNSGSPAPTAAAPAARSRRRPAPAAHARPAAGPAGAPWSAAARPGRPAP